ncbi:hypothetical protein BsWGS_27970 [Bradybaena similaris]
MNEAKPIVTCHGNQNLFAALHNQVAQGLPKEPCEWRRSYGRAPRSIHLEASFVPYDPDILPGDEEKTLVSRPYFHIYWTDCDVEAYKQTVKDDITEWQSALRARNIPDWLIVIVSSDESKVKAKLLPRASVLDKIKGDFCSKYPERCIVLTDPNKLDSRSSESWLQLYQRLRNLLLQAYDRHLNKYEETMRSKREKRNEAGWNYFSYFIFQEELAFMLEMLGLKEDALIQYDELDAMFDQFVENFANGDTVQWLTPLVKPSVCWSGVSLARSLDLELRDAVKQNNASLLQFRNYLFSRQATLLFQMGRAWEVAQRAQNYLYNTVVEMRALEVEVPKGAMCCWVFLSCLEILRACNEHNVSQLDEKFALFTANLWDYAHKKLRELGHLCSLMPGLKPTSEQLDLVVNLVSGMRLSEESLSFTHQTPVDKLRESLSSLESFKRHYLDMCEQAMGTYKYIGRFRSARMIGLELAEFYMKIKEPQKAENFLLDSIKMYQQEGWHYLSDGTMVKLAECQKLLENPGNYLKTACHIACSTHLSVDVRNQYFEETMKTLNLISGDSVGRNEMRASQIFFIENITLNRVSVTLNDHQSVTVDLCSNFPQPVTFNSVQISIKKCTESEALEFIQQQQQQPQMAKHRRQPSGTHITSDHIANFQPVTKQLPSQIDFHTTMERNNKRLIACGITCESAHKLLKRADSAASSSAPAVCKDDFSHSFSLASVTLQPGHNSLIFSTQVVEKGVFHLGQMCLSVRSLDLLKPLTSVGASFKVVSILPEFSLKPKDTEHFLSGIEQEGILICKSGSSCLNEESTLSFSTSPYFSIFTRDERKDFVISAFSAHSTLEIPVLVYSSLKSDQSQNVTSKLGVTVDSWQKTFYQNIEFVQPFQATHRVYTAGKQKYIQVIIEGNASATFTLSDPRLEAPECRDVELVLLNKPDQILHVNQHQNVSLLWQLNSNIPLLPALDLSFACSYSCPLDANPQPHEFDYSCSIQNFQTQYQLVYTISSIEEDKSCTTGETAILEIKIKQLLDLDLTDSVKLAYAVKANGNIWAIGGKSSGVFTMKEGKHSIVLDVVPLQAGHLHFPLVTIYKYLDQIEDSMADNDGETVDSDSDSAPLQPAPKPKRTVSQLSTSSLSSSHFASHLVEFTSGQVYNESRNRQIHVYPCQTTGDIEVSLVQ